MSAPRGRRVASASCTSSAPTGTHADQPQQRPRALITGATSGIGLAVARDLAQDHDLVLLARTHSDLDELAAVLAEDTGAQVQTLCVDLTDSCAVADAVARVGLDDLNVLVHSAGREHEGPVAEVDPQQWRSVLDLNVVAVAHLTSLLLPALRRTRGLVIMMNSGAGLHTWPQQALYCASKWGLRAVADALREEERGYVRVTTIYPGRVDTAMQRRIQRRRGATYRASDHMAPASVAAAVRLAVDTPRDAAVEDLSIRPAGLA